MAPAQPVRMLDSYPRSLRTVARAVFEALTGS